MKLSKIALLIVTTVSLLCGIIFWLGSIHALVPEIHFRFNPYALFSLTAVFVNAFLIVLLWKRVRASVIGTWFFVFLGTTFFWALAESLQRLSATPEQAIFWQSSAVFGWTLVPFAYLCFVLCYIDKQEMISRIPFQIGIYLTITGVLYAHFKAGLIVVGANNLERWGYDGLNKPFLNVFTVWLMTFFLTAITLLISDYRSSHSVRKRKQIKLLVIAALIPVIGGSTTDLIIPGIFRENVVPVATLLIAVQGAITAYGIARYQLFTVNPVSLSAEIMKTLPQPVIGTDEKFEIQFMNASATKLFHQYAPFLGKNIKSLVGKENSMQIQDAISSSGASQVVSLERIDLDLKDGEVVLQTQISKINEGKEGYIFAMADITHQALSLQIIEKQVRVRTSLYKLERARLLASVEGLRQGFIMVDKHHHIVLHNKQAQSIFPNVQLTLPSDGMAPTKVSILDDSLGVSTESWVKPVIQKNHFVEIDDFEVGKFILDIDILPISVDGKVIGVAMLFDDVTDKVMAQRSKDEFFSIASHELRTPLTAIRGNTSMILGYYNDKLNKDMKDMLGDIHSSSLRLIEIVNDFLDTSRLEQGRMQFNYQDVQISKIIEKVATETSAFAKEKGNTIKIDKSIAELPLVHVDSNKIEQVIYNLIGNSLKFTEKGKIIIQGAVIDNRVKIRISDSGRGISKDGKKLLFKKFQQTGSSILTRDTTKGTGLGLYISRLIMENMRGSIGLEHSEPGVGTAFYFMVPVAEAGDKKHE